MYGLQSTVLQTPIICHVLDWQNIVVWTQQHLTKANVIPNTANRAGHQQTALLKFLMRLVQTLMIL